jgi:hypothetical protein
MAFKNGDWEPQERRERQVGTLWEAVKILVTRTIAIQATDFPVFHDVNAFYIVFF